MRERGFTLVEVLIALFIFSLVIGIGYGLLVSVEQFNVENKIYYQVLDVMQNENLKWRSNQEMDNAIFYVDQILIFRDINRHSISPTVEGAEINYHWSIGKKEYHAQWHLDRFLP